jgi:ferritin-like protein
MPRPRVLKSKQTVKEINDHAQQELKSRKELNARRYYEMFLSDPRRFEPHMGMKHKKVKK